MDEREPTQPGTPSLAAKAPVPHPPTPLHALRGPGKRFVAGNQVARKPRRTLNPIDDLKRKVHEVYKKLKGGKIESNVANALVGCLKFKLELVDRFETGDLIAKLQDELERAQTRVAALRARARANQTPS